MNVSKLMLFTFLGVVAFSADSARIAWSAEGSRPNVLFIYVEDLGYYTSERAAREPQAKISGLKTPNLDAFAAQSIVFTRAFCGQTVCSPSKGAIYSGLLPHTNGIWRNVHNESVKFGKPDRWIPLPSPLTRENDPTNLAVPGMHEDIPNLVQRLKAGGVYCALSGKLHVQPARNFPYDSFVATDDLESVVKSANGRPWFFWCNPGDTHAPWWTKIKSKLVNPKDRNSAPIDVDPAELTMLPWLPDTPAARIDLAHYYSCVRNIDDFVGKMLKKLASTGQADNTIVVFTGDHGIPCQRGKTSIYPAATNVPCYVKGPAIKSGRTILAPISQMDFNPTFLEAFGIDPIENTHASSLWPILSGTSDMIEGRSTIMAETNVSFMSAPGNKGDTTMARAVCDGRYYYIANVIQDRTQLPENEAVGIGTGHGEYGDPGPQYVNDLHDETIRSKAMQPVPYELLRQLCMGDAPSEELYDLKKDPWGIENLVDVPAEADTLARMRSEMTQWRTATQDRDIHPKMIKRRAAASKPLDL